MDTSKTARQFVFAAIVAATCSSAISAEPSDGVETISATITTASAVSSPWISSKVPVPVRSRLEVSYEVATQRLSDRAQCRALFVEMGADGFEALASTLYYPASQQLEKQVCRGAFGYTTVGSAPTFLCRRFSRLSERRAALVLIHEALHRAGMGEWPQEPDALASSAINDLVADACGL